MSSPPLSPSVKTVTVFFLLQLGYELRDICSLHGDGVLDAVLEEVQHVGTALDDQDGVRVEHVRSGGQVLDEGDFLDAHCLLDGVGNLLALRDCVVEHLGQDVLRAVDDLLPLGRAHIFDLRDGDLGDAGAYAVDGLQRGGQDGGLHLVQAAGDQDVAARLAVLGSDVNLDSPDAARLLQFAKVQVRAEESLGLAENCSYHVRAFDDAFGADMSVNYVFCRVRFFHFYRSYVPDTLKNSGAIKVVLRMSCMH